VLALATDHEFLLSDGRVFDHYCFGREFFEDYVRVFGRVRVLARIKSVETLPAGASVAEGDGVEFVPAPPVHGWRWILRSRKYVGPHVERLVADADAVVGRVPSQIGRLAAAAAIAAGKPAILEVIGDPIEALRGALPYGLSGPVGRLEAAKMRSVLRRADGVGYVSERHLQARYPADPRAVVASFSSIRLAGESIVEARRFDSDRSVRRVVCVGSLVPVKRHADLIRAFGAAPLGVRGRLTLVGGGPLRESLERLAGETTGAGEVEFTGHVSDRAEIVGILDDADLFVLASVSEGLPRVVIEAMSRGLPVIGSRAGGIPELVREEDLFDVGDVAGLSALLAEVLASPERLRAMSRHSVETAATYAEEKLSPRRREFYRAVLQRAAPAAGERDAEVP
jgi:glycosyltransferase involved in cell wall biosynthesis